MRIKLTLFVVLATGAAAFAVPSFGGAPSLSVGMGSDLAVTAVTPRSAKPSPSHKPLRKHRTSTNGKLSTSASEDTTAHPARAKSSLSVGMGSDLAVSPIPPGTHKPLQEYPAGK